METEAKDDHCCEPRIRDQIGSRSENVEHERSEKHVAVDVGEVLGGEETLRVEDQVLQDGHIELVFSVRNDGGDVVQLAERRDARRRGEHHRPHLEVPLVER